MEVVVIPESQFVRLATLDRQHINVIELIGGAWRNSLGFIDKMLAVKPEDVKTVANKYMKNIRFVVIGNPSAINKQIFIPSSN